MAAIFHLTFESKEFLWFLLIIPLMIILHFYYYHFAKKRAIKFANFEALKKVTGNTLITKNFTTLFFRIVIIIFVIFAVSKMTIWYKAETTNNEFMILLDSGASMNAIDVEPNRFELAKKFVSEFSNNISAKIGIISFAGSIIQSENPMFEKEGIDYIVKTAKITQSGTDIGLAITSGINKLSIDKLGEAQERGVLLLVSDGHDTVGTPLSEALEIALEKHVSIITVGVGTIEGGSFITGPSGTNIISKLDEKNLIHIANITNSNYYNLKSGDDIKFILDDIQYDKTEGYIPINTPTPLIFIAFGLLIIEWVLSNTRFRILP